SRRVAMLLAGLRARPLFLKCALGGEESFRGVIYLLKMRAIIYEEDSLGATFRIADIPVESLEEAQEYRTRLIEALADIDEEVMEKYLGEESLPEVLLTCAIRRGTIGNHITPVFCGASFRNKGVQPLLAGIVDYLPFPVDVPAITGVDPRTNHPISRRASDDESFAALAFKVMVDPYVGQLVFVRVYSGILEAGSYIYNS